MEIEFILYWLSWSALITTITLFFTGIPICLNIYKLGGTGDISGMPFLMGLLGGSFWLRYGFLKGDMTMIQVNVVAVTLFFCYCVFYLVYADVKTGFAVKFVTTLSAILGMALWMQFSPNLDALGILCMTFNILTFGAPLAGLGVVLRKKCVESLPLPMCCFNLMVSSQWFLYGTLLQDKYIMIPNSVGMILAVLQLSLFIIFPRKMHGRSPLQMICGNSHHKSASCDDFEKEPMNLENETNSPIVGEPSVASTDDSQNSPSLYRQHSDARLEKRLSSGFVEGSGAEQQHSPQMRSRSNSVPEMKIPIV